jgi:hypothetical protein
MKREFILQVSGWRAPVTLGYTASSERTAMIVAFVCRRIGELPRPATAVARALFGRVLELPGDSCDLVAPDLSQACGRGWRATATTFNPLLYNAQYLAGCGRGANRLDSPAGAMFGFAHPFEVSVLCGDYVWVPDISDPIIVQPLGSVAVQICDGGQHQHEITMLIREEAKGVEAEDTDRTRNIPVALKGQRLVWLKDDDTPNGPLAYPEHLDENGDIRASALGAASYAHIFDGVIKRYNRVIGTIDDLVFL